MRYDIDLTHQRIKVEGTPLEIRSCIEALDTIITDGEATKRIAQDLLWIHRKNDLEEFRFSSFERVFYNRHSLIYCSTVSGSAGHDWFRVIEGHFRSAYRLMHKG